ANNGVVVIRKDRKSYGRRQPYADASHTAQQSATEMTAGNPQHTFFRQNSAAESQGALTTTDATLDPFGWLTHPDRTLISAGELLQVSALRPYDLLQYFVVGGQANKHVAPWTDPSARLYRFLEFVSRSSFVGNAMDGTNPIPVSWGPPNGRIPGLININM